MGWVLVHGIPLNMFGSDQGMGHLRKEMEDFGGLRLMSDPVWISSIQRRSERDCKFSSVKIAVESEEVALQLTKTQAYVLVCGMKLQTTPLVKISPSTRCDRCLKYGHSSLNCRGKLICVKCGGEHRASECQATVLCCSNCKGAHKATDKSCPAYIQAKKDAAEKRLGGEGSPIHEAE